MPEVWQKIEAEKDKLPLPEEHKAPDNRGLPNAKGNWESPKVFDEKNNAPQKSALDLLNEYRDDLRRKDNQRYNMADPNHLSRKEAIDRQNSFGKPRGRGQQREKLSEREELLRRQHYDEGAGGGVRKRGNVPSLWAGLNDADKKVGGAKSDMEQSLEKALEGDKMSHRRENLLPKTSLGRHHRKPDGMAVLGSFNVEAYLGPQRMVEGGGDKMKNFQYNQVISDGTPPDRYLKDYRNPL